MQHLARADDMSARSHGQKKGGTHGRHGADRHAQRLQPEEADEQQHQHDPAGPEGGRVTDGVDGVLELCHVVAGWNVPAEVQHQHQKAGRDRGEVHRDHHGRVVVEADLEEVGRHDVHEVRHDQRQAGRVGDEARRHDEGERGGGPEAERHQHRHHDGREDQRRTVVRKEGRHRGTQQHDEGEQPPAIAASPAGHMQRGPFEEAGFVEQQADEDDGDEGRGGVPDDGPDDGDVGELHHAEDQCDCCA
ncbi:hypothetical protein FQZ97_895490 [compost metagenome]